MNDSKLYKFKMDGNKIYKKTIFNKWKEIKKNKYLRIIQRNNKYILKTDNFNLFKYLNYKYEEDFVNNKSTYNEAIKCKIIYIEKDFVKTIDNNLCGTLTIQLEIKSLNSNKIIDKPYYKMFLKINKNISNKLLELLFERALNGKFENPWLEEEILKEMKKCDLISSESNISYYCDTCNKKFIGLTSFLSHLIEEKHYTKFLSKYEKTPEIKRIYDNLTNNRKEIR